VANISSNESYFNSEFANELRQLFYDQFGRSTGIFNFLTSSQLDAALLAEEAQHQAGAQNNITLANEQERQQNDWRAIGALSGEQASLEPLKYAGYSLDSSGLVGENANAATRANESGFGAQFEKGLASGLSSALTGSNS
jgi:hypothetical protein